MWTVTRVLLCTLLTLLITTQSTLAQHGPWIEPAVNLPAESETISAAKTESQGSQSPASTQQELKNTPAALSNESKPLGLPRVRQADESLGGDEATTPMVLGKDFVRTIAALGGVLLLIFALAHIYKKIARTRGGLSGQMGAGGRAPAGLVEVLGRYPISSGMTLVVLRFDRKILLLSHAGGGRGKKGMSGPGSMQTLCEMDNAQDVASILGKVRDESGDSIAASFERTLQEAGNATDQEISKAMYESSPGMHVQPPRRIAPGFVTNDEGDRLELTSLNDSPASSQVLRRRLGAMRRGR